MGLKLKRHAGQSLIIGSNSTVIAVELLDGNSAILCIDGEKRRLVLGSSSPLEKGRIIMTLESIEQTNSKVEFDFVQRGPRKNWFRIWRAETFPGNL